MAMVYMVIWLYGNWKLRVLVAVNHKSIARQL